MKHVASIEKYQIIARCLRHSFIHGVIDTLVGFRLDDYGITLALGIAMGHGECIVFRCTIYNKVFDMQICLMRHTVEGALQHRSGVVGDGDDADGNVLLHE